MKERPFYDPNERIFTLADIKRLFAREKKKIFRISLFTALITCCYCLIKTSPVYLISATFKESVNKSHSEIGGLSNLLERFDSKEDSQIIALIQSYPVLKPLIERMGLQAEVSKQGLLTKLYRRIRDQLLAERKKPLQEIDWFSFRNVRYEGEQPISYSLLFEDPFRFSILSGKKRIAEGSVGSRVVLPVGEFTLVKAPKALRIGLPYQFSLKPWLLTVKSVRSKFQISSFKLQKSIYELRFYHRDRFFGAEFLNALMKEYQNYLKQDHNQIAKEQLVYLEEKQEEICKNISHVFDEYTEYLQSQFNQSGQISLMKEIEENARECSTISKQIFSLNLEWERLCRMETDPKTFALLDNSSLSQSLSGILNSISVLKEQRNLIELSLPLNQSQFNRVEYESRKEELKDIRDRMEGINLLLAQADPTAFGAKNSLEAEVTQEKDLAEYLENSQRLLSMREKIIQEQVFYGREIPPEFAGIDLATARSFFGEYNQLLDKSAAATRHLQRLGQEIDQYDFEISSLSAVLSDPLSQNLIEQASQIALKLKDQKHRSEKEENRWTEELKLQKKILKDHLDQLYKVELLNSSLIQDKISALQTLSLNCITGQISVLQERLSEGLKERKNSILAEKNILEAKLKERLNRFPDLPERWRKEKWLSLKTQMGMKMVQALTDLVESKTIASHLHHIESKTLDFATSPLFPVTPHLFLYSLMGAFLAGFASFARSFLQAALSGFPTSKEKLQAMKYPLAGEISPFCDGPESTSVVGSDLETLRQISLTIDQGKVIGVLLGKGPDYSYALAEHLSRMSRKILLVRVDFPAKFSAKDVPGLFQVWNKEITDIPIRQMGVYDFLPSGGYTPYGTEVIRSSPFQHLLADWRLRYDCILLVFRSPLDSVDSISPLSLCDKAVLTVTREPTEQLTPFIDWAYHEDICRLAIVTAENP